MWTDKYLWRHPMEPEHTPLEHSSLHCVYLKDYVYKDWYMVHTGRAYIQIVITTVKVAPDQGY